MNKRIEVSMEKATKDIILEGFRSSMFNPTDIQIVHKETGLEVYPQCVNHGFLIVFAFDIDHSLEWEGRFEDAEEKFVYYLRDDVELKICPVCQTKVSVNDYQKIREQFGDFLQRVDHGEIESLTKNGRMLWEARVHADCYWKLDKPVAQIMNPAGQPVLSPRSIAISPILLSFDE